MSEETKNKQENTNNLEERVLELEENWKRALADYKNLERRVAEERLDFIKFANANLLIKLFHVYDSLKAGSKHNKEIIEPIYKQMVSILESEGLKIIEINENSEFDPAKMEVVEGSIGDKIGEVVQDGFTLDGKVIRPVRVELS